MRKNCWPITVCVIIRRRAASLSWNPEKKIAASTFMYYFNWIEFKPTNIRHSSDKGPVDPLPHTLCRRTNFERDYLNLALRMVSAT